MVLDEKTSRTPHAESFSRTLIPIWISVLSYQYDMQHVISRHMVPAPPKNSGHPSPQAPAHLHISQGPHCTSILCKTIQKTSIIMAANARYEPAPQRDSFEDEPYTQAPPSYQATATNPEPRTEDDNLPDDFKVCGYSPRDSWMDQS
jgi:hypothetical protein